MKTVMTVLGPMLPRQLGIADAHTHGWIEAVSGADLDGLIHDDENGICHDLATYRELGGRTIIDCQPGLCGRNGNMLRLISQSSGVLIVACTGFHLQRYYPTNTSLFTMTAGEAVSFFLEEIRKGLLESRVTNAAVYPGFIKIAAEATLNASPLALFEAAAEVSLQTDMAIEMHTEKGDAVEDFLDFFISRGLAPDRLVFCHVDKRPDIGLHQELASAGVMLEYDTFIRPKYEPEVNAWPLVEKMVLSGLGEKVALATDLALTEQWPYSGGLPGPGAFLTVVRNRLIDTGMASEVVAQLTGENIANRLAIDFNKEL